MAGELSALIVIPFIYSAVVIAVGLLTDEPLALVVGENVKSAVLVCIFLKED